MKTVAIFVAMFAATISMKLEKFPPGLLELGVQEARLTSQILAGLERKPSQQSTGRCVEYGIGYLGYDIEQFPNIPHWSDCAQQCFDLRICAYWSWEQNSKICYVKTSNEGRQTMDYVISGAFDCLSEC